jgi:hypothetical protein
MFAANPFRIAVISLALGASAAAQVSGTGSANFIARWTSASSLGNSIIFQSDNKIGIRNTNPAATLDVLGASGGSGQNAVTALNLLGGAGGSGSAVAGTGGRIQLKSGAGGHVSVSSSTPGGGATLLITGGSGPICIPASTRCAGYSGGSGGSITLQPGSGGSSGGHSGNVLLATSAGRVGVKTSSPSATLTVGVGGTTLADAWTTRSAIRFKTNVHAIPEPLRTVSLLQGVRYEKKSDGSREVGFIAEEVAKVLPEVVSVDADTNEVDGIDYSRLTPLLVEAIKDQQRQIDALRRQVAGLLGQQTKASK